MTQLKELIKERYKSEALFGVAIGFTPQKVCAMLAGRYAVKLSDAVIIADALDISIYELVKMLEGGEK